MSTESRNTPAPLTFGTRKKERFDELTLTLRFITPMFGGGTTTKEAGQGSQVKEYDKVTPVRGASIRGQLRFWWRATTGAWCSDIQEMKRQEDELFGAAAKDGKGPGKVGIRVDASKLGEPRPVRVFEKKATPIKGSQGLAYGAFSLSPQTKDESNGHDTPGVLYDFSSDARGFELTLTCPQEKRDEVLLALSAWAAFGGLGGRTTRGFGRIATESKEILRAEEILERVTKKGSPRVKNVAWIKGGEESYCHRTGMDHNDALRRLQSFRQAAGVGRNTGEQANRPGRSRWPEPDEIRRITGRSSAAHKNPLTKVRKFPRAAFGMPIIFHFKDSGEPGDQSLQPQSGNKRFERMRSPMHIAPQADGSTVFLVLQGVRPEKVSFDEKSPRDWALTPEETRELRAYVRGKEAPEALFSDSDPLIAFLNYVRDPR